MITKVKYIICGICVVCGVMSCNEEPDGSNLFSSDQKTIAEMLRDRSELSAFYRKNPKSQFASKCDVLKQFEKDNI